MSDIIKQYYEKANMLPALLKQKLALWERHADIGKEFEHWIQTRQYVNGDCVEERGYTAEKLASLSEYLNGEAAFMLLIELRETPEKAMSRIQRGFKKK